MSHSYRKHTILQDNSHKKFGKKFANRKVRRAINDSDVSYSPSSYKKFYESWNISDYSFGYLDYNSYYRHNRCYFNSDSECWSEYKRTWKSK